MQHNGWMRVKGDQSRELVLPPGVCHKAVDESLVSDVNPVKGTDGQKRARVF
jgi:hypothetical protein